MTTREVRQLLFNVSDQDMTVQELRERLFEVVEQDNALTNSRLSHITGKKEEK